MKNFRRIAAPIFGFTAVLMIAALLYHRFGGGADLGITGERQDLPKITAASFQLEVAESPMPVLIDFYADWCGPCRQLAPIIDQVAEQFRGQVKVVRVNVDEQPELAKRFNVSSIPKLVVLRRGEPIDQIVGLVPQTQIVQMLQKAVAPEPIGKE